jgi:hypothetical protein
MEFMIGQKKIKRKGNWSAYYDECKVHINNNLE